MGTHYGVRPTGNIRPKRRFRTSLLTVTNTITSTGDLGNPITIFGGSSQNIVWEFTHVFPRFRTNLCFFECGASGNGLWYGIRGASSGNGGVLRFRAGDGSASIDNGANDDDNCACLDITNFPQTGKRYLVTLQYSYGSSGTGGYVEIYINNRRAGKAFPPNNVINNAYGGNPSFFFGGGTASAVCAGESQTMAPNALLKSDLLHFHGQTVRANPT